jgi:hypothetical protein
MQQDRCSSKKNLRARRVVASILTPNALKPDFEADHMKIKQRYIAPTVTSLGSLSGLTRATNMGPYCDQVVGILAPNSIVQMSGTCNTVPNN